MKLRPYQLAALDGIHTAFARIGSTLIEMATGTGKTVIFSRLVADRPGRSIIMAHREELIAQAAEKIAATCGVRPEIEMGELSAQQSRLDGGSAVVVTSVQTMSRPNRLARYNPADFSTLVIDEAHHAVAASYRTVIAHFRQNADLKVLGVTATPKRTDEAAMGQVFESVAYRYGIEPAIDDGWLVPVTQQVVKVEGLDFSKVKNVAGDFNAAELSQILTEEEPLHKMTSPLLEIAGDRPGLVFCVDVAHARLTAAMLNRYRSGSADWLSGETPKDERRRVVAEYKSGKVQFLCNCALFLEGFDAPTTAVVVMARPTQSTALYCQVLGRGTRALPGVVDGPETPAERRAAIAASGKPDCLVIDFVGNSGAHKIVQASDILGGKWSLPVRQYAKKNLEEEGAAVPVELALERADAEMALELEEAERRRKLVAQARYRTEEVSPFDSRQRPAPQVGNAGGELCSDKQAGYIVYLSRRTGGHWDFSKAKRLTKKQANGVISKMKEGAVA